MPESRAGLSAQTYLLPQPQQQAPMQQEQPFNDGVQALEGLQYVQNQTSDYYKKVSALKSFMQSANKNLGIDVRVPDMSRPESIELNQIYQTAMADILAQGNELKQGAAINNMHINRGDQFTDSYYGKSAAQAQQGRDVYSGLEKIVTESNDAVTTPSYNDAELKAKQEKYDQTKAYYEAIKEKDPAKTQYADAQIAGLAKPAPRVYRPNNYSTAADRKYGREVEQAGAWIDKMAHFQNGAHDSFKVSDQYVNDKGTPYLISQEFAGESIGDQKVVEWRFDPDNETLTLLARNSKGEIVPQKVSQGDFQVIIRDLSKINTGAIMEAISNKGAADKLGQFDSKSLVTEEGLAVKNRNINDAVVKGIEYNRGMLPIKNALENLKGSDEKGYMPFSGNYTDDEVTVGGKYKIKKEKGKWIITNIADVYHPKGSSKDVATALRQKKTWSDVQSLLDFLRRQKAHLSPDNIPQAETTPIGTNVAPTTTTQSGETDAARILREYRERNK